MKWKAVIGCIAVTVALSVAAAAQSISVDHIDGLYAPDTIPVGHPVTFWIRVTNNNFNHGGITNGFRIYSPDGASWGSTVADTLPLNWKQWFGLIFSINRFDFDGTGADTVGFGGTKLFETGLPAGFDSVSYKITIGPIDAQYHGKTIVLDSSFYRPIGTWKWAGPDAFPAWDGPHVSTIYDPNAGPTAHLQIGPTPLHFSTTELGPDPAQQMLNISTVEGALIPFTASETASWMELSSSAGTTPASIGVSVHFAGLSPGTYVDSIQISAADAVNSPQYAVVEFEVTEVLKYVVTNPSEINDTVISGHANPSPTPVTVTEVNNFHVPFQAAHNQNWVHLTDSIGTTPGSVMIGVDASGLAPGSYIDTVYIHWQPDPMDGSVAYTLVRLTVLSNHPPQLFEIADFSITECDTILATFHATDGDNDVISMWVDPLSNNMSFTYLGDGDGRFVFAPDFSQAGDYALTAYASDGIDTVSQLFNIHVDDCQPDFTPSVVISPPTMYAFYANPVDSFFGIIHFGNFVGNHSAADVDLSSVRILGDLIPESISLAPSYPGFVGDVIVCQYSVPPFVQNYMPFYDTSFVSYTVSGQFTDDQPFEISGNVRLIGHITGDVTLDNTVDIEDIVRLVEYYFAAGPEPVDPGTADLDKDGRIDITDLVRLVERVF